VLEIEVKRNIALQEEIRKNKFSVSPSHLELLSQKIESLGKMKIVEEDNALKVTIERLTKQIESLEKGEKIHKTGLKEVRITQKCLTPVGERDHTKDCKPNSSFNTVRNTHFFSRN